MAYKFTSNLELFLCTVIGEMAAFYLVEVLLTADSYTVATVTWKHSVLNFHEININNQYTALLTKYYFQI
jgi:hypothetical protein